MTCMTRKTTLFQYVIRVYPIDIQKARAGLFPPLSVYVGIKALSACHCTLMSVFCGSPIYSPVLSMVAL